jgi:urea carboxylase-associated protein 2
MVDEVHGTDAQTGTLAGARDHARRQAGTAGAVASSVPVGGLPDGVVGAVLWNEVIEAGGYTSRRLPRGSVLRLEDTGGDACVQLLVHNAIQPAERLNVADTVKVQWQAYLAQGALLLSDMGRVLMTVVADTSARHDCLCGCSTRASNTALYGDGGASGRQPNGRDLLALGLAKVGLSRLDVGPNVNLFKSVRVDASGALHFDGGVLPGTHVELRAEVDVIVTLANTPHPLDDRLVYTASPLRCLAWLPPASGAGAGAHDGAAHDPWRASTPERQRAFENTEAHLLGLAR